MWISFCEFFLLTAVIWFICVFTFFTKYREVQVLGIRNLSRKMALKMIPIQKTGLHFFEFRAQGQRICKLFKLTRYFIFYCLLQTRHYGLLILVGFVSTSLQKLWQCYDSYYQAASSLNSSYCYILHDGDTVFTWIGNLSSSMDQELAERQLDVIKVWGVFFSDYFMLAWLTIQMNILLCCRCTSMNSLSTW